MRSRCLLHTRPLIKCRPAGQTTIFKCRRSSTETNFFVPAKRCRREERDRHLPKKLLVFGSVLRIWQKLRQQPPELRRNERLLQDRPPCTGQESPRRGA